jgi:hypothetical protein
MPKVSKTQATAEPPIEIKLMLMLARGFEDQDALPYVRWEIERLNIHEQCRVRRFLTTSDNMLHEAAFKWATLPEVARPEKLPKLAEAPPERAAKAAA